MTLPEDTRYSLLIRLGSSDDGVAWTEFLRIYEGAIYACARRKGLQDADARDVVQDVLVAVHERVADWDPDPAKGRFRGWLFRVVRNLAVDTIARRSREIVGVADSRVAAVLDAAPARSDADATAFVLEYRRRVFRRLAAVTAKEVHGETWRAFWLTAVDGRSAEDVARELECTVGRVYTAKCRVLARIRERFEHYDEGEE